MKSDSCFYMLVICDTFYLVKVEGDSSVGV